MTARRACCSSGRRAAWVTRAAGLRRAVGPAYVNYPAYSTALGYRRVAWVTGPPMVNTPHTIIARAVYHISRAAGLSIGATMSLGRLG